MTSQEQEMSDTTWAGILHARREQAIVMPDTTAALERIVEACDRLEALGWHYSCTAPHNTMVEMLIAGGTSIIHGYRDEYRRWWDCSSSTTPSPAEPFMYRSLPK